MKALWRVLDRSARTSEARTLAEVDARLRAAMDSMEQSIAEQRALVANTAAQSNELTARAVEALRTEIRALVGSATPANADSIAQLVLERVERAQPWGRSLFAPKPGICAPQPCDYMRFSTCSAADFKTSEFLEFCAAIGIAPRYHRKYWEWAFIVHHFRRLGLIEPGRRGIVFGVGTEALPSLFARSGAAILATDAPPEIGLQAGWNATNEFGANLDAIHYPAIVDRDRFLQLVSYGSCDMTAIPDDIGQFDFCWSSCCLEHLGNLQAGMDFVVNSVEKALKPGGVAVHTTEINLSSNTDTVSEGQTVLYRKRDIEQLVATLRSRGHEVSEFRVAPDADPLDFYVDLPPYTHDVHLKLSLLGYTSTSGGLVITRGR